MLSILACRLVTLDVANRVQEFAFGWAVPAPTLDTLCGVFRSAGCAPAQNAMAWPRGGGTRTCKDCCSARRDEDGVTYPVIALVWLGCWSPHVRACPPRRRGRLLGPCFVEEIRTRADAEVRSVRRAAPRIPVKRRRSQGGAAPRIFVLGMRTPVRSRRRNTL